ncbi:hypothetical protein CA984_17635 [Streptosporangium minutum]|uniref:Uncharacterized protein n=1 Tax=Streptosporangium minutum TaxID=569862 RepID=A0A243RLN1_9ACTN|nr:hypothetical protein CA984_17635 [Streptosporangium minutum]
MGDALDRRGVAVPAVDADGQAVSRGRVGRPRPALDPGCDLPADRSKFRNRVHVIVTSLRSAQGAAGDGVPLRPLRAALPHQGGCADRDGTASV